MVLAPRLRSSACHLTGYLRHPDRTSLPLRRLFANRAASHATPELFTDVVFGPKMFDSKRKVAMLRELMVNRRLDAYIVPSADDHASEYLAGCDQRRAYLTHFTGSAGTAIVTATEAMLWTDGRYWLQAERELDLITSSPSISGGGSESRATSAERGTWKLMKAGKENVPPWTTWLARGLGDGDETLSSAAGSVLRIGIDPRLLSWDNHKKVIKRFEEHKQVPGVCERELVPLEHNLVDEIWEADTLDHGAERNITSIAPIPPTTLRGGKPPRHISEIFILPERFSGQDFPKKLTILRERLYKSGAAGMLISDLDEICWMLNLRSGDIPYNPVFFGYVILTRTECTLFVDPKAITDEVRGYLGRGGVAAVAYEEIWQSLRTWGSTLTATRSAQRSDISLIGSSSSPKHSPKWVYTESEAKELRGGSASGKILIGNRTSWAVAKALGESNVEVKRSLVEDAKAIKNATEIEGSRRAHIRDGAALCRYFAWLEEILHAGRQINEYDAASQLEEYRKQNEHFRGLSFPTISSTGPNGAVIHYEAASEGSAIIDRDAMYLCDSGAQYLDGTTDTTRTIHFGTPTSEERRNFTRVLQGHIAIDTAVFPKNTTGFHLDTLARRPLWGEGLDYRHGTGHGVGSFLNVHEGPHGIGAHEAYNEVPLKEEPGYYADGKYGIRIENIVIVRRADPPNNFEDTGFMEMEHVTMCPIQNSLVDVVLLTAAERRWLDEYHEEVLVKVRPELERIGDDRAVAWLERECRALEI